MAEERAPALSGLRLLFATAADTDRTGTFGGLGLWLLASVLRPIFPLLFALLIDGVVRGDRSDVVIAAVAIAVLSAVSYASVGFATMFLWNVWERMTITIDEQLVRLSTRIGLVDRVERPDYLVHLTLVRSNREHFQESMMSLLGAASLLLQVAITVVILVFVAPVLLLLPLFSAAPILASRWADARVQRTLRETSPRTREADSFMMLAIDADAAGELRVLHLRDLLQRRHDDAWDWVIRRIWRSETTGVIVSTLALMVFTAGFGGAVLLITLRALDGGATLGSVILVLTAGQQLHTQIGGILGSSGDLFRITELLRNFGWLLRYVEDHADPGTIAPQGALRDGLRLEDVSFRYPGTAEDAVRDVSLTLPADSVVAVVGENGAGKSTMVKLLCGLLLPTSGRIVVDGVDVAELDRTAWHASLSGAFQDFVRLQSVARESIGVGRLAASHDVDEVRAALRRADVAELEDELPEGLETLLGRYFYSGTDLSGGQWQKVALARSMMREAPLVRVLDEPTYSLDVESERRVFEWFSRVARADDPVGTITVVVSHRFSTVRTADVVAVMRQGRVVETGTHAELMALDGDYAHMYRTQATGYR